MPAGGVRGVRHEDARAARGVVRDGAHGRARGGGGRRGRAVRVPAAAVGARRARRAQHAARRRARRARASAQGTRPPPTHLLLVDNLSTHQQMRHHFKAVLILLFLYSGWSGIKKNVVPS